MVHLKVSSLNLNKFQKNVLNILDEYFRHFIPNILSDKSYFDSGDNPDCFLYSNDGASLVFSIWKDELHVSSVYFDIYISSKESIEKISLLCKELLLGHYITYVRYGENETFIEKQTIFDNSQLSIFNDLQGKLKIFKTKAIVKKEDVVKGYEWITL